MERERKYSERKSRKKRGEAREEGAPLSERLGQASHDYKHKFVSKRIVLGAQDIF